MRKTIRALLIGKLRRLEDLSGEFFALAKRDKDHDSAHLVARLNERICAMRGWNAPVKMDPSTVQVEEKEQGFEQIYRAIVEVPLGGNGEPGADDALPPKLAIDLPALIARELSFIKGNALGPAVMDLSITAPIRSIRGPLIRWPGG